MGFAMNRSLLDRALEGDSVALNAFIAELKPHVERQLLRYPVTDDDRRDLLQVTLMQVVRRLSSFRGDSSFSTWLFRVTANEALMLMRSQRRHRTRLVEGMEYDDLAALPAVSESDFGEPGDTSVASRERDEQVRLAVEQLPADYRDVVLAHYHQDLGLEEIAGRFDLSESAVRSRLHRARTRLRTILEGSAVAEEAKEEAQVASTHRAASRARTSKSAKQTAATPAAFAA
jgi:RNA polymerase sigma-70 factor (ECF subfamily)